MSTLRSLGILAPVLLLVSGGACTGSLEADVCAQASQHVADCVGAQGELPTTCDEAQAELLLEMSCDEINQDGVKFSDPFGLLCMIFPSSIFCPSCDAIWNSEVIASSAPGGEAPLCEQELGLGWATFPRDALRGLAEDEACCQRVYCAAIGGQCLSDPADLGRPADCADFGLVVGGDATCEPNTACCVLPPA